MPFILVHYGFFFLIHISFIRSLQDDLSPREEVVYTGCSNTSQGASVLGKSCQHSGELFYYIFHDLQLNKQQFHFRVLILLRKVCLWITTTTFISLTRHSCDKTKCCSTQMKLDKTVLSKNEKQMTDQLPVSEASAPKPLYLHKVKRLLNHFPWR